MGHCAYVKLVLGFRLSDQKAGELAGGPMGPDEDDWDYKEKIAEGLNTIEGFNNICGDCISDIEDCDGHEYFVEVGNSGAYLGDIYCYSYYEVGTIEPEALIKAREKAKANIPKDYHKLLLFMVLGSGN